MKETTTVESHYPKKYPKRLEIAFVIINFNNESEAWRKEVIKYLQAKSARKKKCAELRLANLLMGSSASYRMADFFNKKNGVKTPTYDLPGTYHEYSWPREGDSKGKMIVDYFLKNLPKKGAKMTPIEVN